MIKEHTKFSKSCLANWYTVVSIQSEVSELSWNLSLYDLFIHALTSYIATTTVPVRAEFPKKIQ